MRNLILVLSAVMIGSLYSGCGTLSEWKAEVSKDIAALSHGVENGQAIARAAVAKAEEIKAVVDAKLDKARDDLAAKGAPVNGTPAELTEWAKQNPLTAAGSPLAFLMVLGAAYAKYRTAKRALTASVDGAEAVMEKHPDAAETFKTAAASSSQMGSAEAALIASIKSR